MHDYWKWLGTRAIGLSNWRWRTGMLLSSGYRIVAIADEEFVVAREDFQKRKLEADEFPDFRDPATVGCLLDIARKRVGQHLYTLPHTGGYWCAHLNAGYYGPEPSEAEVLVDVLEYNQKDEWVG
jgi:hypothetical protein